MFAQESVMDIQKEREAFEKECRLLCYKGNMVMSNLGSFYNNEQTNWMWQMWLSAKAQAVPEGFVLVNAESLALHAQSIRMFNNSDEEDDYYEIENHVCAIEAMIETQEQTND